MFAINNERYFYDVADGMGVVIDFTTGYYYAFNAPGTACLNKINEGSDPDAILKAALKHENCSVGFEDEYLKFISALKGKEMIVEIPGECPTVSEFCPGDFKEGKLPHFDEFAEMQDLLMADPIHETDENEGWPVIK